MMNCIVEINGREAIPVRAIPYIARELISPERLVSGLARTSFAKGFWYLNVFHISPDGSIGRMLPINFNEIESNINDINRIDRYRDMTNNITPKIRFMRSICAFPPCFIWRDEFEEKYEVALEKIKSNDIDARLEDIEINFNPYMSPEEINIVFEGMPRRTSDSPSENLDKHSSIERKWPWGKHETELLRKLAEVANQFWTRYDPSNPATAPMNKQVISWLEDHNVPTRTAEIMAQILRADGLPTGPRKIMNRSHFNQ